MWPILACSVLATGIIVERCWSLSLRVISPARLIQLDRSELSDQNRAADPHLAESLNSVLGSLLLRLRGLETETGEETYDLSLLSSAHEMEKYLTLLGVIGLIAPLLGILGTIVGMIEVFDVMAYTGTGNPRAMASGVSKATLPTMTGLVISISGLFAITIVERFIQDKTNKKMVVFEND